MGEKTKIEWCDSTVNPTDFQCCGCELWNKKTGLKDCYAGRFAERRAGIGAFDKPVVLKPGRMAQAARWRDLRGTDRADKPWLNGRPRVIFIGDMADTLQPIVPFNYLFNEIFMTVRSNDGQRHVWMWLTKQAKRMVEFQSYINSMGSPWPENLWPGVSVTSNRTAWRVDELVKIRSEHRFISYEPAWELVDFSKWLSTDEGIVGKSSQLIRMIIMGGQSGAGAKDHAFNIDWADETRRACEFSQVNFFLKQLGAKPVYTASNLRLNPSAISDPKFFVGLRGSCHHPNPIKHPKGGDWAEWPEKLRVRQFPEV